MTIRSRISAADYLPPRLTLPALQKNALLCHGCHLYKKATQTVFGVGNRKAQLMIVGEIPGKKEDETSIPFTGPAGTYLREVLADVGLNTKEIYFTNVVKHFKFAYLNKKKLHRSPVAAEINACRPWLDAEIEVIQPDLILCLGVVAAKTLVDKNIRINQQRGRFFTLTEHTQAMATFHPSAILRAIDEIDRHRMKKLFRKDITKVANYLQK